jgi:hypothetical protein
MTTENLGRDPEASALPRDKKGHVVAIDVTGGIRFGRQ